MSKKKRKKQNQKKQAFKAYFLVLIIIVVMLNYSNLNTQNFKELFELIDISFFADTKQTLNEVLNTNSNTQNTPIVNIDSLKDNHLIDGETCNLSGMREANVVVDIGYGDREYFAYTNSHQQLVYVSADVIKLQDDKTEDVTKNGRYCHDEAKVSGTEKSNLDEGHVIADSLGGTSTSYNITPQDSYLNRSGEYSEMESLIRDSLHNGHEVTDFKCSIVYPNETTQIPSDYQVSFKIDGKTYTYQMENK